MKNQVTYHLKKSGPVAMCGSVSLWPLRAVVGLDLFRPLTKKYSLKVCQRCRAAMPKE